MVSVIATIGAFAETMDSVNIKGHQVTALVTKDHSRDQFTIAVMVDEEVVAELVFDCFGNINRIENNFHIKIEDQDYEVTTIKSTEITVTPGFSYGPDIHYYHSIKIESVKPLSRQEL